MAAHAAISTPLAGDGPTECLPALLHRANLLVVARLRTSGNILRPIDRPDTRRSQPSPRKGVGASRMERRPSSRDRYPPTGGRSNGRRSPLRRPAGPDEHVTVAIVAPGARSRLPVDVRAANGGSGRSGLGGVF